MTITGAIVIFVIFWWLSFFVALPFGVRGQYEDGDVVPGSERGAPVRPELRAKVKWATIGAVGLTALLWLATFVFDFQAIFLEGQ